MPLFSAFEILAERLVPAGILPVNAVNPFLIQGYWVQISLAPGSIQSTIYNVIFQETTDFNQGSGQSSLQAQYIDQNGQAQVYSQFFASTGRGFLNQKISAGQTIIYGVQCIPASILTATVQIPQNGTGWRGTVTIDAQNPGSLIATPTQRLLYLNADSLTKSTPLDAVVYSVPTYSGTTRI